MWRVIAPAKHHTRPDSIPTLGLSRTDEVLSDTTPVLYGHQILFMIMRVSHCNPYPCFKTGRMNGQPKLYTSYYEHWHTVCSTAQEINRRGYRQIHHFPVPPPPSTMQPYSIEHAMLQAHPLGEGAYGERAPVLRLISLCSISCSFSTLLSSWRAYRRSGSA